MYLVHRPCYTGVSEAKLSEQFQGRQIEMPLKRPEKKVFYAIQMMEIILLLINNV